MYIYKIHIFYQHIIIEYDKLYHIYIYIYIYIYQFFNKTKISIIIFYIIY